MNQKLAALLAGAAILAMPHGAQARNAHTVVAPMVNVADSDADQGGWRVVTTVPPVSAQDRIYGNPAAAFTVTVWSDPECPYCKMFGDAAEQVVDASGGKVNLILRLLPLSFHGQAALVASATSLCVADQAGAPGFYRFFDAYLRMTGSNGKGLPGAPGDFAPVAALAGAAGARNLGTLTHCVQAPETMRRLAAETDTAQKAGVTGTPAIAVHDNATGMTVMTEGAISADDLQAAIAYMAKLAPADADGGKA